MNSTPELAVLLAAGRGRRLRPHTDHTPKPLLPVHGRPTLDYVLTAVARAGVETVCLVTHHLGEQIEEFVGDGAAWGLQAVTCRQPELDGTAPALQTAVSAYPELFGEERPFLLTATDYALPPFFLRDLVQAHLRNDAEITISLKRLPPGEISRSSSVSFRPDGRIERIIEKPAPGADVSAVAASLIFVLPGGTRDYVQNLTRSPRGEFEIQDVINRMLQGEYTASGLVQDAPPEPTGAGWG